MIVLQALAAASYDVPHCIGQWLPSNKASVDDWLQKHIEKIDGLVADGPPKDDQDEAEALKKQVMPILSLQCFSIRCLLKSQTKKRASLHKTIIRCCNL